LICCWFVIALPTREKREQNDEHAANNNEPGPAGVTETMARPRTLWIGVDHV
jgi:hypothetical protein